MSLGGGKGKMTQQTSTTAMTTGQEWLEILAFGQTMQDKYGSDARDVIQTALLV